MTAKESVCSLAPASSRSLPRRQDRPSRLVSAEQVRDKFLFFFFFSLCRSLRWLKDRPADFVAAEQVRDTPILVLECDRDYNEHPEMEV